MAGSTRSRSCLRGGGTVWAFIGAVPGLAVVVLRPTSNGPVAGSRPPLVCVSAAPAWAPLARWPPPFPCGVEKSGLGEHPARLCSGPVAVALFASFSFLKASSKLLPTMSWMVWDECPCVLLSAMVPSVDVGLLHEGFVGALLRPCLCSIFGFPAAVTPGCVVPCCSLELLLPVLCLRLQLLLRFGLSSSDVGVATVIVFFAADTWPLALFSADALLLFL